MDKKELVFERQMPKQLMMSQNRVRLTDEATKIIEDIYLETNIPLTQIASEMIKFANAYTEIKTRR